MNVEQGWKTNFLTVIQQSEYKKGATLAQLLFEDGEEAEELVDDYGYEEIINREHDEELEEILGEELFYELERNVFMSSQPKEKFITFLNGLGFQSLDYIVLLEAEFHVDSAMFSADAVKKLEKRFPKFPYVEDKQTIFDMTLEEAIELLENVTGLKIKENMNV
ncbi:MULTISPECIES: hypothetical protein [unclassified Bacillus (in: firmicutes)]|uniref:hypothetical protein n=1 Tax=unclassified Bacillus (in: firmicutes) TaxID=185979 RepID=UPI0008EADBB2|nr:MULTISPECIES: hypothetical protein [unclassified Bacillus (in: firmicutes)]SFI48062.1 hypothetical protein SAMN04488574_10343 [Bacillus sp. 71mf]SFS49779.1 hypothetical protein SAMN04488145_101859 [Bacillus sp. 103mf]